MNAPVTIRTYVEPDWPHLCAIHDAARQIELASAKITEAAFAPFQKCAYQEGFFANKIIVATQADNILGFAAYRPRQLTWLYVDPNSFSQGIGQKLITHILANTERPLDVQMLEGNQRAQRLYEFMGFAVHKRTKGKIQGRKPVEATGLTLRLNH